MSDNRHTPGPWRRDTHYKWAICGGFVRICEVLPWDITGCREEDNANARLIAAAPALLEALEVVEWVMDEFGNMYCPYCDFYITHGHKTDCKLGNALKLVRGE